MEPVHHPVKIKKVDTIFKKDGEKKELNKVTELESLRTIIGLASASKNGINKSDFIKWRPILIELSDFLSVIEKVGDNTVLLASHAFLVLQKVLFTQNELRSNLQKYLSLKTNQMMDYNIVQELYDVELFKLHISYGFLQLRDSTNNYNDIYECIFQTIYSHCVKYTPYTYFAFKILQKWMKKTSNNDFWSNNSIDLEEKLETIIFSNWDNSICKTNIIEIFSFYLIVMEQKYENYIVFLFNTCVEKISWCHVTKYVILSEICRALDNVKLLTESNFISNLFNSLTNSYLCSYSGKIYSNICKKLTKDLWISTFEEHLNNYVITWEAEKNYSSIQTLCKRWIEPVLKTYRDILPRLLENCDEDCILYRSHLFRLAKKYGISVSSKYDENALLDHKEELVRLNIFAAYCYEIGNSENCQFKRIINVIKRFLYFNATTDVTFLREGILNYFKIFLSNILKYSSVHKDSTEITSFLEWIQKFFIDSFEVGSCYQRKIYGLQLNKICLQFLQNNNCKDCILSKDPNFKEAIKYGPLLQTEMKESGKWKFTNKESLVLLFKLVLDSAVDVREISTNIIIDFFDAEVISDLEKMYLFNTAISKCNSYKFFETESGACLFKILTCWFPFNYINKGKFISKLEFHEDFASQEFQSYVQFLYQESNRQLSFVKNDILKAVTQNSPFYGVLTAYSIVGFCNGPENHLVSKKFLEETLLMAEHAVHYFLNAFSPKSTNQEYSSSFKEMGLAIDEAIKSSEVNYEFDELVLSPAQQSIITCIWRSLKVLCELCVEIAKNKHATDEAISRASELIVMVSLRCRHKGVIESSGVAIGKLSRYMCTTGKNTNILEGYLKKLSNNDFSTSINLTRRGAGLTIMFHKIIANDVRSDRPLLHFSVKALIQSLKNSSTMKVNQRSTSNYDDPCAMHLHFLKTLVADKELQPQLSPYLEQICLICFDYMPSKVFIIRNASYQLFGALVIRLSGQNTGATSIDFGYGYSINYFVTHFPELADKVLLSLQVYCQPTDQKSKWKNSMHIIHFLSLLSKMFYSGCELTDGTVVNYVKQIKNCLDLFMGDEVAHVRNLAAKSYVASVGLTSIENEIRNLKTVIPTTNNFNKLNGYLKTLEYLCDKQDDEVQSRSIRHVKIKPISEVRKNLEIPLKFTRLWNYWNSRASLIKQNKLCYIVEAQLVRLSHKFRLTLNNEKLNFKSDAFISLDDKYDPGFYEFVDELMSLSVNYMVYNDDYSLINYILGAQGMDYGINFLKHAPLENRTLLISSVDFASNNFEKFHPFLLEKLNLFANESIIKIIKTKLIELQYNDISKLKVFATKLDRAFERTKEVSELMVYTHVLSLRESGTDKMFEDMLSCILNENISIENYFDYPEVLRKFISKGLQILLYNFDKVNESCREFLLLAVLILMKDEVSSVRETIRDSVVDNVILRYNLSKNRISDEIIFSTIVLNLAAEKCLFIKFSSNLEFLKFFEKYFSSIKKNYINLEVENPFDHESIYSYKEESKIINLIVFCIESKILNRFDLVENIYENAFDSKEELLKKVNIESCNLYDVLNLKYDKYLAQKLNAVKKEFLKK